MLKLLKYLKPYWLLIVIAVGLLFVQANADLALPDYMSRIVNVGIQQGGVENAVPTAVRSLTMDRLLMFLGEDEQAQVLAAYTLVDETSADYDATLAEYPALADGAIYVRGDLDKDAIDQLNAVLGRAWLIVAGIEQVMADPSAAAQMSPEFAAQLAMMPPGTDLFAVIKQLPEAMKDQFLAGMEDKLGGMEDSLIAQAAVIPVRAEYDALGMDTGKVQNDYILQTGLLMLGLTLLSGACTIAVGFLSARTAAGFARDVRREVFAKVEGFSSAEFDKFSTASLITRSTNDITQIQMVVIMMMRMVIYAPIIGVGGVIRALGKATDMWWIIALAVVVILGLILTVFAIALPKFKSIQNLIDRLNLVTRENLAGMMVIRAFNMQDFEEQRFDKANLDLTKTMLFINRIMVIMMPVMMLVMNGVMLTIIWVGAHEVAEATMQVGDMMAFMQYAMQILFAFLMMSVMFILLPRAFVSGDRIGEVLETEASINDPQEPRKFPEPFKGLVEFRKVSFRYPGAEEDVLHEVSFTARPGETTAFLGTTGSGKSTIVSLIPRFYETNEGSVLVDGIDVREVTQRDLRERIGYVPQKSNLFSGTIESNLRYADENASEEALNLAAEIAQASEFIASKEEGMQAEISQGGANVSGGQRQRLAIARALVAKPQIYIFDDSFSALDYKTDAALRKALKKYTGGSTVLVVTQRVGTIKNAEQIVVLDEGRVVGKGRHHELMKTCEVYRDIALSQLSKEELA